MSLSKPSLNPSLSGGREGLFVGNQTVSQYDGDPEKGVRRPLSVTRSSQINAEFVYRGSSIESTNRITLPASTK
ncbi:hypothetical protein [Arthrobacter sp. CAN_A1]|uniref:hypothetical protein n=1 Tax=Arthrobacter sp. CAN_A1 TaxID=2787717 RepID=UPI0018C8EDEC